jgi:hypothetical protein
MSDQQEDYADDQQQIPANQTEGNGDEEAETEASGEEQAEGDDGEQDGSQDQDKPKKRRNRPGKTERELAQLREQVQFLAGQLQSERKDAGDGGQQAAAQAPQKPQYDQYDSEEQYLDALASYYADQRVREREERQRQETQRERQQREQRERATQLQIMQDNGFDKYDDFEEVALGNHWNPSDAMVDAIADSEHGHDIAYYLGSNPDEAKRIAQMSPTKAAREIGRLESRFNQPKQQQTSKAPPPVRRSRGTGGGGAALDPSKMPPDEYVKARRAGKI